MDCGDRQHELYLVVLYNIVISIHCEIAHRQIEIICSDYLHQVLASLLSCRSLHLKSLVAAY